MVRTSFSISTMALLLVAGLALVGVWLLVRGWRGRRVGTEPRCRRCGYILLHLESAKCPECGLEVSARNTVIGERRRRWGLAMAGTLLLLVACLPMVPPVVVWARAVPWYHYKPGVLVLRDLDSPASFAEAITELQRRELAGELSASVRGRLIEKALQEQSPDTPTVRQGLVDFLGTAWIGGYLSDQQKERMVDQACVVTMETRAIVGEGDQVSFWVWHRGHGPSGKSPDSVFWARRQGNQRRIDGKVVRQDSGEGTSTLTGESGSGSAEPAGAVGKHTIEADTQWSVWHGTHGEEAKSQLIGRRKTTAKASYEVVPRERAPRIELLDSEELRAKVMTAVQVTEISQQKDGHVMLNFSLTNAPCDLAFEVFVAAGGVETKVGSICCSKGKSTHYGTGGFGVPQLPAKAKVTLRSSVEVAKGTVDQTAIYSGEIVFSEVAVKQESH